MRNSPIVDIQAARLLLRRWRPDDREFFAKMNSDKRVMEFFPSLLTKEASDASVDRIEQHFEDFGYGLWAVEIPGVTSFAGFIGLFTPRFEAHFTPCTEIGWRLAADYWGRGYATEGARAVLNYAFHTVGLNEIVAMTVPSNRRSRQVMERIGMTRNPTEDFKHPMLPADHELSLHVLYRLAKVDYEKATATGPKNVS